VLGAAQADALGAEPAGGLGVARDVGIGAHAESGSGALFEQVSGQTGLPNNAQQRAYRDLVVQRHRNSGGRPAGTLLENAVAAALAHLHETL
jgi:hypothetical protein